MNSPFVFGRKVSGSAFADRLKDVKRLKENFKNGVNTILISPRRWGKSSLVSHAAHELMDQSKAYSFCFLDLFKIRTEEEFYSAYAKTVLKASASKTEEVLSLAKSFLKNLVPRFSFSAEPNLDFEVSFNFRTDRAEWEEILDLPEKIALRKKRKVIVCLDEFQNIGYFSDPLNFQKLLRSVWQNHQHVTYTLYGSKKHMMMHIFTHPSMPFYRFGDVLFLEKIDLESWSEFIVKKFNETNKKISIHQARQIIGTMENHSYYIQQFAHLVWCETEKTVFEKTLTNAMEELLQQNTALYQKETEALSNTQIRYLQAVIDGVQQLASKENIQKYGLGTSANVFKIKSSLQNKEIIDVNGNAVSFLDPVFRLWFKKNFRESIS